MKNSIFGNRVALYIISRSTVLHLLVEKKLKIEAIDPIMSMSINSELFSEFEISNNKNQNSNKLQ